MNKIGLIAFDLDGTLLTSDKRVTKRTADALQSAADMGIAIVPATGRYIETVPDDIRKMKAVTHFITINGAYVFNAETGEDIYRSEISVRDAVKILEFLDSFDVTYDCYANNSSFMTESMKERAEYYIGDDFYLIMLRESRKPVRELKAHLSTYGCGIQKLICYTRDAELKKMVIGGLTKEFSGINVTSSAEFNVEINAAGAHKGIALKRIAQSLGIDIKRTMAFGDSFNDIPLLDAAGVKVCMENGEEEVKRIADIIAPPNDMDGVARVIEKEVLNR